MKTRMLAVIITVIALLCMLPLTAAAADPANEAKIVRGSGDSAVETEYPTLEEAIGYLEENDTLYLLKDVTIEDKIIIDEDITFDGQGYTITRGETRPQACIDITADGVPILKNFTLDGNGMAEDGIYIVRKFPLIENVTIKNCRGVGIAIKNSYTSDTSAKVVLKNVTIDNCVNGSVCIGGGARIALEGTNNLAGGTADGTEAQSIYASWNHPGVGKGDHTEITIESNDFVKVVASVMTKSNAGVNKQDDVYEPVYCWTNDRDLIDSAVVEVNGLRHLDFFSLIDETVEAGDTIELLRDVEIDRTIHLVDIHKSFTFDGNNHKITPSATFTRNNTNLQYLIDIDKISENSDQDVMVLKDLILDNKGKAYGLNTWVANVNVSNVKILNSKSVGFSIYNDSQITANKLTVDGSEFLGILVKFGSSLTGTDVNVINNKLRGIDVHFSTLDLTDSRIEAGNIGILGHGDNGWKIDSIYIAALYDSLFHSDNTTFTGHGNAEVAGSRWWNGQYVTWTTKFKKFTEINNTITLDNTDVIGGTAIEVKQTKLNIQDSEIIATGAPAVYMNANPHTRTTFGYAIALTPFNVTNDNLYAVGEITVSNSCIGGPVGIRAPKSYDMDVENWVNAQTGESAFIKFDDQCVFDAVRPTQYLANANRMFVANTDTQTSAKYPYMIAVKQVENSSVSGEVEQEITSNTTGKSADTVEKMDAMSSVLADAVAASKETLETQNSESTGLTNGLDGGKSSPEPNDTTEDKESVTPRDIVDVEGMANTIANDNTIITDDLKSEAANNLGTDDVEIQVQSGIDIEVVDVDESNAITVDIEPVYQLYAYADGKDPLPVSAKQSMAFEGTSVKVSIPLVDGFAEVGDIITVEHTKEDGTTHSYEATVVKVGDLLYAEFENPNGFSQFTLKPANSDDEIDEEEEEEEEDDSGFMAFFFLKMLMQRFDFTVIASEGGTVTTDHVGEIRYGQRITYTITPDEGYEIADVLINGESIGVVSEYTFRRYKKDQTIEAIFTRIVDAE